MLQCLDRRTALLLGGGGALLAGLLLGLPLLEESLGDEDIVLGGNAVEYKSVGAFSNAGSENPQERRIVGNAGFGGSTYVEAAISAVAISRG